MGKVLLKFERLIICAAMVAWLFTAYDLVRGGFVRDKDSDVVSTFCSNVYYNREACVYVYGNLGSSFLSDAAKEVVLIGIAENIGINRYDITKKENETILNQASKNGNVMAKIISSQDTNYIYIGITLTQGLDSVNAYKEIIEKICKTYGIKENVCISLKGEKSGKLSLEEKNLIAGQLIEQMNAKEVTANRTDDVYTVYAYDKRIDDYISVAKKKININITMNYDEENDVTHINLCTPINNEDF